MDSGYITALAALGGAALGGLTSFATSWTTLRTQMKAQQRASSKTSRQKLYKAFIDHAAKVYGDALVHDKLETTGLIDMHALVSRMRIVSSGPVIETAVNVVKMITETYSQPNKSPEEIEAMIRNGSVDVLRSFSEACRNEFEQSLEL
jgi:CRISPR/Cas system CSM-associated protein Csm4 (group 5 of RAMP superfamily)